VITLKILSWEDRFEKITNITDTKFLPFSDKIEIEEYIAKDLILKQRVILKLIKIDEDPDIVSLAQYLWHYEISLNQRASNNSKGNSLLKLLHAQRDEEKGVYVIVTEYSGPSLRDLLMDHDESEDSIFFNNFLRSSDKKKILWEAIYKLAEGLYALHFSGLIHRNISLDTIYFDSEAYQQGEKEIFKIGDFNWSIYLCSLSNVFTDDLSSELIKDNYHFFRAPECLPSTLLEFETSGETYQSDLFSLGLVISFLILGIEDIEKYTNSQLKDRPKLYEEIYLMLENFNGYPLEKEILLKLVCVDVEERFQNINDLMNRMRELLNIFKHNFIEESRLPINFNLERNSPLLRQISNILNISIDAILEEPDEFLSFEFKNCILLLTNDLKFPLYAKGSSGTYYKFGKAFKRSNLSQIRSFLPNQELNLELKTIQIGIIKEFYWLDREGSCPYSRWEEIFRNATSQIKELQIEKDPEIKKRERWLKTIKIIGNAEKEIEKKKILNYQCIYDSLNDETKRKNNKREVIIQVFDEEEKELFSNIINEAESGLFELLDTDNLFEPFKRKRVWKVIEITEGSRNNTQLILEGDIRNHEVPENGFIRSWDLKNTIFLLKRKRQIIQDLENNEYLLNAILNPASTHTYFEKYDKNNLVSFIYYTNPIFLLQGPPGTGKTYTATKLIKYSLQKDPFSRILIASKEHSALDDLLIKCQEIISETSIYPTPKLVRLISPERELKYSPNSIPFQHFITNITKMYLKQLYDWIPLNNIHEKLSDEIKSIVNNELDSPSREWINLIKESSNLIFCTTTTSYLKELEFSTQNFDLVIIEEAGKTYPSELFKPIQLGNKWVLIGDQNQLPPFRIKDINRIIDRLLDDIEDIEREKESFDPKDFTKLKKEVKENLTIFNSIFNIFKEVRQSFKGEENRKSCDTLLNQWRLPSKISKMISTTFYDQEFYQEIDDPVDFIIEPTNFRDRQLIWVNIPSDRGFKEQRKGFKLYNNSEIRVIKTLLSRLKIGPNHFPFKLVILSPYKEQVERLKNQLPTYLPNLKGINIKNCCFTVDGFQGQEADLVIISLVRNNFNPIAKDAWGFVPESERLNVMFSRAKKTNIIIGCLDLCLAYKNDPFMEKFIKIVEFIQSYGKIINLNEVID